MLFQGAFFPVYYLGTGIFNLNYLLSYPPVQDSVFLCQLPQQFREVECNESDLKLSYLDSNISSPLFSKLFYPKNGCFPFVFVRV